MSILKTINEFLFGSKHFHLDAEEYLKRGIAKIAINDFKGAISDFTHVIEHIPDSAEAYYNRGLVYDYLDDATAATEDLLTAKRLIEEKGGSEHLADIAEKLREIGQAG